MYVGYQIQVSNLSHNATCGNHHMYVGYQIHFSILSHNATWENHHMHVGYKIHPSIFLIMQRMCFILIRSYALTLIKYLLINCYTYL